MRVPKNEFDQLCAAYDAAEQAGEFDQLFKGEIHPVKGTNKEEFLHSFSTGMKLYKSTFLKIYGYELSYPGYADKALGWLEMLGCSKARAYYSDIVAEYEHERDKGMREVASWHKGDWENMFEKKRREVKEELWRQKEAEPSRKKLRLLKQKQEALNEKLKLLRQKQAVQSMTKESLGK